MSSLAIIPKTDVKLIGDHRLRLFRIYHFDIQGETLLRPDVVKGLSNNLSGYGTFFPPVVANIIADYMTLSCEAEGQVFETIDHRNQMAAVAAQIMKLPKYCTVYC